MYSDFRQSPEFRNLLAQGGYEFADLGNGCGGIISKIFPIPFLRLLVIQGVDMPEVLSAVEPLRRKHHLVSARIAPKAVVGITRRGCLGTGARAIWLSMGQGGGGADEDHPCRSDCGRG